MPPCIGSDMVGFWSRLEQFFADIGVPVATRTTAAPKLDQAAQAEFKAKSEALAAKYRLEMLQHA